MKKGIAIIKYVKKIAKNSVLLKPTPPNKKSIPLGKVQHNLFIRVLLQVLVYIFPGAFAPSFLSSGSYARFDNPL